MKIVIAHQTGLFLLQIIRSEVYWGMSYYAYIHCKPDGTPFYVGKGIGGTPVECEKDGVILRFPTISHAARHLGLNPANITHHLKRTGERKPLGVNGWVFRRISLGG